MKKIVSALALAGAVAFAVTAPAVLSASAGPEKGAVVDARSGNWPDPA